MNGDIIIRGMYKKPDKSLRKESKVVQTKKRECPKVCVNLQTDVR